jgi:hypothetical protein
LNPFRSRDDKIRIIPKGFLAMNSPEQPVRTAPNNGPARRIAVAVILSGLVFAVLWIMVFSMVTSLLIGAGCCVVIVAASSVSDLFGVLLDAVATVIFGVLAVIAAIFGAIFSLFGF